MNFKEYLLKQSAINLSYIAEKMWPTNKNAKSYLSTKLNDNGRPWTESDNEKAGNAIHELGLQLIKDAPIGDNHLIIKNTPKKILVKKNELIKTTIKKEPSLGELWSKVDKK